MRAGAVCSPCFVVPGLVPGIHVLLRPTRTKDVDGRVKPGHDEWMDCASRRPGYSWAKQNEGTRMSDDYQRRSYGDTPVGFGHKPGIVVVDFMVAFTNPKYP